jgi:2-methylisocitrate lyase-like PEP mutase family enzyme
VRRARAYREVGADLIFVDGIRTVDDIKQYASKLGDLPLLYNGGLLPVKELAAHGFKVTIHTSSLMASYVHFRDAMRELKETGSIKIPGEGGVFGELIKLMGVPEVEALAKKYQD